MNKRKKYICSFYVISNAQCFFTDLVKWNVRLAVILTWLATREVQVLGGWETVSVKLRLNRKRDKVEGEVREVMAGE